MFYSGCPAVSYAPVFCFRSALLVGVLSPVVWEGARTIFLCAALGPGLGALGLPAFARAPCILRCLVYRVVVVYYYHSIVRVIHHSSRVVRVRRRSVCCSVCFANASRSVFFVRFLLVVDVKVYEGRDLLLLNFSRALNMIRCASPAMIGRRSRWSGVIGYLNDISGQVAKTIRAKHDFLVFLLRVEVKIT